MTTLPQTVQASTTSRADNGLQPVSPRRGLLAVALQEVLTAVVRLRADRQVAADADSFRRHIRQVIAAADQEARRAGYEDEQIRYAIYATVAFLDESVLNSTRPMFAEWPRRPLQEELYGGHLGGEIFFDYVQQLLARPDSEDLADVLEVYQLCLLLGFSGRYGVTGGGELQRLVAQISEKIRRIRGPYAELSPSWVPPLSGVPAPPRDRWIVPLAYGAIAAAALAGILFLIYRFSLSSAAAGLQQIAVGLAR
jgi:type VI secretion system protein ImpK